MLVVNRINIWQFYILQNKRHDLAELNNPLSLKLSWEHRTIWDVFRVKAEHLPQWGKKNPFSRHHLVREKFRECSFTHALLCTMAWADLYSEQGGPGQAQPPAQGPYQQHSEKELDVTRRCNKGISTEALCRECVRDAKSPPSPTGALRDTWHGGVQQAGALNREPKSGKRESLKILQRRWVTNHPPVCRL